MADTPLKAQTAQVVPGMEGLSEEERLKIQAVMACAELDAAATAVASAGPSAAVTPLSYVLSRFDLIGILSRENVTRTYWRSCARASTQAGQGAVDFCPVRLHSVTISRAISSRGCLSEKERAHIEAVMASAERDSMMSLEPQPTSDQVELPGLEGLSASEREQILAVMESARRDAEESRPPTAEPLPPPPPSAFTTITTPEAAPSISPSVPPGLEELSAEERAKIMAVMASAAMEEQQIVVPPLPSPAPPRSEPPSEPIPEPAIIPRTPSIPKISPEQEKRRPSDHMVRSSSEFSLKDLAEGEAERREAVEDQIDSVTSTSFGRGTHEQEIADKPGHRILWSFREDAQRFSDQKRVAEPAREQSPEEEIPGVDLSHLSPSEREQIRAVMRMAQMDDPGRREGLYQSKALRGISINHHMPRAERMYDVLEDAGEVREGAHSRNDSRADDRREDFDFTYSDARFSDLNDDNFDTDRYKVSLHDESGVSVDAVEMDEEDLYSQQRAEWTGGRTRMWTTVFEGDESEQPADDVFIQHSPTGSRRKLMMDLAMHSRRIEFDTGVVPSSKAIPPTRTAAVPWTPMGIETPKKATPEITVTVHDDRLDSEDEESGSEDDDEYPDKVVAAPIAPTPTYEEVEQERQRQEQYGKEVLQQIQAFGEAANDEFDVQWAKSTLQRSQQKHEVTEPSKEVPAISMEEIDTLSSQKHDAPLEIVENEERRNPFLESPEDEDVSVDMEEVDVNRAAQFYQSHSLFCHRPGPVYTIPEDANECDGTIENTESRLIARREKATMRLDHFANSIIVCIVKPTTTTSTTTRTTTAKTTTPSTSTYTIIALGSGIHTRSVTSTVDSHVYSSHSHTQPAPSTVYTSSYLFSSSPLSLSPSVSTVTLPATHTTLNTVSDIPASISASIDKTMADIESLLDSVYTSEKSQPNLLYYDQKPFQQAPTPGNDQVEAVPVRSTSVLSLRDNHLRFFIFIMRQYAIRMTFIFLV
ncbi:hypothetical protein OSTOST_17387 [Ostertagia ostertagi]